MISPAVYPTYTYVMSICLDHGNDDMIPSLAPGVGDVR